MIEIKLTGMCEGCTHADLELDCMDYYVFHGKERKEWTVKCKHAYACDAMEDRTIARLKGEPE